MTKAGKQMNVAGSTSTVELSFHGYAHLLGRSTLVKRDLSSAAPHVPHEAESPPLSGSFPVVEVMAGRPVRPGGGLVAQS
ncbi:hypothetical protein [Salinibacter ruber]|uniref:hypothetical protein n=1 Tax=Salinibacter ruber TaxID=146919 RepID=UPI0013C31DAB|nr:hypothetical protein [Salinibacter ruber]